MVPGQIALGAHRLAQIRRRARAAIAQVANATLRARALQIWSEATTAYASDSTRFSAWEQNLVTEWHVRYRVPGIMIYWHAFAAAKASCWVDGRPTLWP